MSTTTQDVLLGDEQIAYMRMGAGLSVHGSVDANPDAVQIAMEAAEGGCRFAMAEMEAERTNLLDLIRQGAEAVKKAGHAEECDATSELHEQLPCGEGWVNLGAAGPCNCGHEAFLAKVKEELPNL